MNARSTLVVTTPSDRELTITRIFNAPRDLVFEAFTKPDLLKRWLHGPEGWLLTHCEIDLRVGGRTRYVWQHKDGRSMGMSGEYREIVRPSRIVATELFDEDWTGGEAVGTPVFTEKDGKTTAAQTMLYVSQAARDGAKGTGMEHGMEASYRQLDSLLADEAAQKGAA